MARMNVLVTGGTGFVGQEVVRELARQGHRLILAVRTRSAATPFALGSQAPFEVRQADLGSREGAESVTRGCDAVIHLIGIISELGANTFERAHVRTTQHLVAAAQAAGVARWIHMSALGTRPGAVSRYHQTKWAAEEIVRRSGLRTTIFRPSLIYGPGDDFVNRFERMSRWSPILPMAGPGTARLQPVAVEVVARCFVRALTDPGSEGACYDLGGPALSFRSVLETILEVTGRRRCVLPLPLALVWPMAAVLEKLFPLLLRRPPPLNRDQVQMLQEDNVGDSGPAVERFGIELSSFREGIRRYLPGRDSFGAAGASVD
jgi:NADH dehydrogenase